MNAKCQDCIGFYFCQNVQPVCDLQQKEHFIVLRPKVKGYINRTKQLVSTGWTDKQIAEYLVSHYSIRFTSYKEAYSFIRDIRCGKYNRPKHCVKG